MRDGILFISLAAALLAGCTGSPGGTGSIGKSQHEVVHDLTVAVSAGTTWYQQFQGDGRASYSFGLTDGSSVDLGFMRAQNVQAYAGGSSSTCYACHTSVSRASDAANLEADSWAFFIHCDNTFADCDGIIQSVMATY